MLLCEADGKALLARHGVAVPRGRVVEPEEEGPFADGLIVKAQLLAGGRQKAGLISVDHTDTAAAVRTVRQALLARGALPVVLLEERLDIAAEYYLSVRLDDVAGGFEILFAPEGGVAVEERRARLVRVPVDPLRRIGAQDLLPALRGAGVGGDVLPRVARLAADLVHIAAVEDAELIEINPLVVRPDGRLAAADAKISLDDSAAYRHPTRHCRLSESLRLHGMSAIEREASAQGCTCVELPGSIALVTAGAGLGMLMIDLLHEAGFSAACFFDNAPHVRGDSTEARLRLAFAIARQPSVRAIVFYQMLTTRDLRPRIEALLRVLDDTHPPKPFYFGLRASYTAERSMTGAKGRATIAARGYATAETPNGLVALLAADRDAGKL